MRRLLDWDPATRHSVWHSYDDVTGETTIDSVWDAEPTLELNKAAWKEDELLRPGRMGEFFRVASIPNGVIEKWLIEEGIDLFDRNHWTAVQRKLNDPSWRYLRTSTGRV